MEIADLDREFLLRHARNPLRVGELIDAHASGECQNPLCGDRVSVSLIIDNDTLKSIKILPVGCNISLASASLMTEIVEGKKVSELHVLIENVSESFSPKKAHTGWSEHLMLLSPLKRIRENPIKISCVLISWMALRKALMDWSTDHFR